MGGAWLLVLFALCAGVPVFLGGLASWIFERKVRAGETQSEILHTLTATGGGIILAAVAFVLVPTGIDALRAGVSAGVFAAGALSFFALDRMLEQHGGSYAQLLAMLMDFVPEAIALGAVFATDHSLGLLLAVFIGLQNLPEAFNSYRDLRSNGYHASTSLILLFALVWVGPAAAIAGRLVLSEAPALTGALMLFAAGGLVYLIFQDIAPRAWMKRHYFPAVGSSLGFLIGMIGHQIVG